MNFFYKCIFVGLAVFSCVYTRETHANETPVDLSIAQEAKKASSTDGWHKETGEKSAERVYRWLNLLDKGNENNDVVKNKDACTLYDLFAGILPLKAKKYSKKALMDALKKAFDLHGNAWEHVEIIYETIALGDLEEWEATVAFVKKSDAKEAAKARNQEVEQQEEPDNDVEYEQEEDSDKDMENEQYGNMEYERQR